MIPGLHSLHTASHTGKKTRKVMSTMYPLECLKKLFGPYQNLEATATLGGCGGR